MRGRLQLGKHGQRLTQSVAFCILPPVCRLGEMSSDEDLDLIPPSQEAGWFSACQPSCSGNCSIMWWTLPMWLTICPQSSGRHTLRTSPACSCCWHTSASCRLDLYPPSTLECTKILLRIQWLYLCSLVLEGKYLSWGSLVSLHACPDPAVTHSINYSHTDDNLEQEQLLFFEYLDSFSHFCQCSTSIFAPGSLRSAPLSESFLSKVALVTRSHILFSSQDVKEIYLMS